MMTHTFKGKDFLIVPEVSSNPDALLRSFLFENDLRDKWWNVQPGDVVMDVGAAFGSYTLSALSAGASLVVAFEPNKDEMFDLMTSVLINGWVNKCALLNIVASSDPDAMVGDFYPESHSALEGEYSEKRLFGSLDGLFLNKTPKLDWLKIDVEGMEVDVLKGALGCVKKYHPTLIIENHIAFREGVREEIAELLTPLGYTEENHTAKEGTNDNWSKWTFAGE